MRNDQLVAFDENIINTQSTGPVAVYTPVDLSSRLGLPDQLTWHAISDQLNATDTLNVNLQHSADGRNWVTKTTASAGVSATTTNNLVGSDQGLTPSLGFVRFQIYFNSSTTFGHVKVLVTARDARGR